MANPNRTSRDGRLKWTDATPTLGGVRPPSAQEVAQADRETALQLLRSRPEGLGRREARIRLRDSGRNELARIHRRTPLALLFANFTHLLALLLWFAAFLSFVGRLPELGWAIIAVILINGVFSFAQEYRAGQLLEALRRRVHTTCRVRRGGHIIEIDSALLVPGDVVLLAEGERVPADCRLLAASGLEVDESALTGESAAVAKTVAPVGANAPYVTYPNLVYAGTLVVRGDAEALVWATGNRTQFGAISELTVTLEQAAGPLHREIEALARTTALIAILAGLVIWAVSTIIVGRQLSEGFVFAVGILVALVPEGLLPTLSLSLAIGVQRMARRNVLVRRLSAVEALGATQVICTDKTGTLTQNRMVIERIWLGDAEYAIEGHNEGQPRLLLVRGSEAPDLLTETLVAATLASNARLLRSEAGTIDISGDPTDVAILELAEALSLRSQASRLVEIPFDAYRRMMSTVDQDASGRTLHVKGAPDTVLERCTSNASGQALREAGRRQIMAQAEAYAAGGLRVLAIARRALANERHEPDELERDLQFLGLVAMIDPIRPQAAETIARCRQAGIRVVIITGDHPGTALEIARRAGIVSDGANRVVTGVEFERMTPAALRVALQEDVVFARTTPVQKLSIVTALQEMGQVVAVIGDGVNDAPSLRRADVGVAMGGIGTDVAREAADIVLLDDNFATIIDAIEEGRAIFANIRKFVTYVFTSNVAELAPFAAFVLTGIPLPLKIVQVLAVDLGTDLIPALALGAEPPEPGVLNERPRKRGEPLINAHVFLRTFALLGPIEAALGLSAFLFVYWTAGWRPGEPMVSSGHLYTLATTTTFTAIVVGQIGNVLACRSSHTSLFALPLKRNPLLIVALAVEVLALLALVYAPPLRAIFDFAPLGAEEWTFVLCLLPVLPLLDEARKLAARRLGTSRAAT